MTDMNYKISLAMLEGEERKRVSREIRGTVGFTPRPGVGDAYDTASYLYICSRRVAWTGSDDEPYFDTAPYPEISHQDFLAKYGAPKTIKPCKIEPCKINISGVSQKAVDSLFELFDQLGVGYSKHAKQAGTKSLYIELNKYEYLVWASYDNCAGAFFEKQNLPQIALQGFISKYSPVKEPVSKSDSDGDTYLFPDKDVAIFEANQAMLDNDLIRVEEKKPEPVEEDEIYENGTIIVYADKTFSYAVGPTKYL